MKTKPVYLVIDSGTRTVVRSRQSWPSLYPGEIVVRVSIEIPDELLPRIQEVTLEDLEAMAVGVDGESVEVPA